MCGNSFTNRAPFLSINASLNQYKVSLGINLSSVKNNLSGQTTYVTIKTNTRKAFQETVSLVTKLKLIFGNNDTEGYEQSSLKIINSWDFSYKRDRWFGFKKSSFFYGLDLISMSDSADDTSTNLNFFEM